MLIQGKRFPEPGDRGSWHRELQGITFTLWYVANTVTKTSLLYSLCLEAQFTAVSSANVWLLMEPSAPTRLPLGPRQFISDYNVIRGTGRPIRHTRTWLCQLGDLNPLSLSCPETEVSYSEGASAPGKQWATLLLSWSSHTVTTVTLRH